MLYHPDRNDSIQAQEKFIQIKEAYEILTGRESVPKSFISKSHSNQVKTNPENDEKLKEQRAREAYIRLKQLQRKEYIENERYYQNLIRGVRWKTIRFSALVGVIISILMISEYLLPHHFDKDKVSAYNLNYAYGLGGKQISLIKTANEDFYWVEKVTYDLYGRNRDLFVESSWFFHNPIQVISKGKIDLTIYNINFNVYSVSWLLIGIFLIPAFTIYYKRKKISFTVLHYLSYYGVNAVILLYLFSGNRWAHLLTFGFL